MGEMRNVYKILVGKFEEKRPLGRLDIDGKIILKWIFGKLGLWCGLDSCGLGSGPLAGSCELGNEPLGSIKGREFFDYLSDF
jgi:hypothetical protein